MSFSVINGQATTTLQTWEPLSPLESDHGTPPFPVHLLPGWLHDWVVAVSEATQTPPDLAALLVLAICGAGLAKRYRVRIRNGWTEPTNLFTVTALPPGERKSAVFADAMKPVQEFESEKQKEMAPLIAQAASEHRILEESLKEFEKKAAKTVNPSQFEEFKAQAKQLAKELDAHVVPPSPQVFCDDETPENLARLLAEQGGRILQASAEGTAFEIIKGRYKETPNFDVYLKGHSGDPLRVGRISRGKDNAEEPALSAALTVQPDVIQGLAENASMRGRGLLARWIYAMPRSRVGDRNIAPPPVPKMIGQKYIARVKAIWQLQATTDELGQPCPYWLQFSPAADQALQAFEAWLEPRLREGEALSLLAGWANKLAGAMARVAAILHMAEAIGQGPSCQPTISVNTVEAAISIGRDYFLPHAQAAFTIMATDPKIAIARRVLKWLTNSVNSVKLVKGGAPFLVSQKNIHSGIGGNTCKAEELEPALALLVDCNYLHPIEKAIQHGQGRKRGPRYQVNPAILEASEKDVTPSQNSPNSPNTGVLK